MRAVCALAAGALLAGCERQFSATAPAGPQAERISDMIWLLTWLGTAVFLAVVGFLFYALWRGARRELSAEGPETERTLTRRVGGAVGVTTAILLGLLVYNFYTGRALAAFADSSAITIRVTGHQWWWSVEYQDPAYSRRVQTANEIHVPVGRKVRLEVQSRDVIHSFWAPNLHGKLDLIPGYSGTTYFRVDEPGTYHGRCAEFCGLQHAKMNFLVIAEPPERFAAWYEAQLKSSTPPADSLQQTGQQVFLSKGCVMCHTIRGTQANSRIGPDLTHLASRSMLASGTLPNTPQYLAAWIIDPQRFKKGSNMPATPLSAGDLNALMAYLETLK